MAGLLLSPPPLIYFKLIQTRLGEKKFVFAKSRTLSHTCGGSFLCTTEATHNRRRRRAHLVEKGEERCLFDPHGRRASSRRTHLCVHIRTREREKKKNHGSIIMSTDNSGANRWILKRIVPHPYLQYTSIYERSKWTHYSPASTKKIKASSNGQKKLFLREMKVRSDISVYIFFGDYTFHHFLLPSAGDD